MKKFLSVLLIVAGAVLTTTIAWHIYRNKIDTLVGSYGGYAHIDATTAKLSMNEMPASLAMLSYLGIVPSPTLPLSFANGGTGATTSNSALNGLLSSQTGNTGSFLTTNGTNASWSALNSTTLGVASVINGKQNTITTGTVAQYLDGTLALRTFPTSFPTVIATGTITRAAATGSGTQVITTPFRPAYVIFSAVDNADSQVLSDGVDDGTQPVSTGSFDITLLATLISANTKSHSQSISVIGALGNGHSARITTMSSTSFTLTWTKAGSGRDITVKYFAIY